MVLKRDIRLQFMMAREEIAAIDDFRFEHRLPNRSAAVRELVRIALVSRSVKEKKDVNDAVGSLSQKKY